MHHLHHVFSVSLSKHYRSHVRTEPPPPPELVEDHLEWSVEQMVEHRTVKHGKEHTLGYLTGWECYGEEQNFQEPAASAVGAADLGSRFCLTLPPHQRLIFA